MIENIKKDTYIENIKKSILWKNNSKWNISKSFNINIIVYKKEDKNDIDYHHYINIIRKDKISNYILIENENDNHFNLLKIPDNNFFSICTNANSKKIYKSRMK